MLTLSLLAVAIFDMVGAGESSSESESESESLVSILNLDPVIDGKRGGLNRSGYLSNRSVDPLIIQFVIKVVDRQF